MLKECLLGTKVQEKYWAKRHMKGGSDWGNIVTSRGEKDWVRSYWNSRNHSHRPLLLKTISGHFPFSSVLEIGCNCGPNLHLIAIQYPGSTLRGIDINPFAVQTGNELFTKASISNVKLTLGKADDLSQFEDKSFSIVFTDAVLIYVGPDKIRKVLNEMVRVAQKALILVEWHFESQSKDSDGLGVYHLGCWKRNYVNLIKHCVPAVKEILCTKIPPESWEAKNWQELGYIIEVNL